MFTKPERSRSSSRIDGMAVTMNAMARGIVSPHHRRAPWNLAGLTARTLEHLKLRRVRKLPNGWITTCGWLVTDMMAPVVQGGTQEQTRPALDQFMVPTVPICSWIIRQRVATQQIGQEPH